LKRFQVSEKFAGKTGPCPKCKGTIKIPDKSEQVVIHAPEPSGPKDTQGRPVLKPIVFQETKVTRKGIILSVVAVVAVIAAALTVRMTMPTVSPLVAALGAILAAPPLVWAGYAFVRDPELEGFNGKELQVRVLICSVAFAFLWVLYWKLPAYVLDEKSITEVSAVAAAVSLFLLLGLGGLLSVAAMELEYPSGVIHCALYLVVTVLLALIAGIQLAAPL
jgi:cation transport ATPase